LLIARKSSMATNPETQQPVKKYCIYCEKEIHGRDGKIYCNVDCKNNYNSSIRSKLRARENEFFPAAFKQIKINYRALLSLNLKQLEEGKTINVRTIELKKLGFDQRYCTNAYLDQYRQIWKSCFDHLWYAKGDWLTVKYDENAFKQY
jgi:hypothetical protein